MKEIACGLSSKKEEDAESEGEGSEENSAISFTSSTEPQRERAGQTVAASAASRR